MAHGNASLWSNSSSMHDNMTPQQMMDMIKTQRTLLARFGCGGNITSMGQLGGNTHSPILPVAFITNSHNTGHGPLSLNGLRNPPGFGPVTFSQPGSQVQPSSIDLLGQSAHSFSQPCLMG